MSARNVCLFEHPVYFSAFDVMRSRKLFKVLLCLEIWHVSNSAEVRLVENSLDDHHRCEPKEINIENLNDSLSVPVYFLRGTRRTYTSMNRCIDERKLQCGSKIFQGSRLSFNSKNIVKLVERKTLLSRSLREYL